MNPPKRVRIYVKADEAHARLDDFKEEAERGLSDRELAQLAGVSPSAVTRWRYRRGIRRPGGHLGAQQHATATAMVLFGDAEELTDVRQRARSSATHGEWKPPEYVVREGVNYDRLLKHIYLAHHTLGLAVKDIADAHGYTVSTVRQALQLYTGYLKQNGKPCLSCHRVIDAAEGANYCSESCRDLYDLILMIGDTDAESPEPK